MNYLPKIAASLALASLLSPWAHADEPKNQGCIDVSVDQYRAPDYNCLSQQMGNDAQAAQATEHNQQALKPDIRKQAPNQLGLSNPSSTGTRMGNTFGKSVLPQRPPQ